MNAILIDDETVALNALHRRVEWSKYGIREVFLADSMQSAQQLFSGHPIDIMISDIEMPRGSGLDLYEWVKIYYPHVECVYVTCHPDFAYLRKALQLGSADYLLKPIDYVELDRILTQLVKRLRERKPHAQPETVMETGQEKNAAENDVVQAVKDYVRVHIRDTIYIGDIAASVFLNEQHLMRIFKRETGVSVLEYITGERLAVSKRLLITTALPVNQVALQAGYENYSYFIRLFKRNFGMTPQVYRQNGGKTNE